MKPPKRATRGVRRRHKIDEGIDCTGTGSLQHLADLAAELTTEAGQHRAKRSRTAAAAVAADDDHNSTEQEDSDLDADQPADQFESDEPNEELSELSDQELTEDELADEDSEQEEDRPAAACRGVAKHLAGAWTAAERKEHATMVKQLVKQSTSKQYAPYINRFKEWCKANKMSANITTLDQAPILARFLVHWCSGGSRPNRKKGQKLGPQGCMNVHAALCLWVKICCVKAGTRIFKPTEDSGYHAHFKSLTKGRGAGRKNLVAVEFSKDNHMKLCTELYGSDDPSATLTRLLMTLSISTVSRGDEIRDVKLSTFAAVPCDRIGPASCTSFRFALTDHKVYSGKPEQKAFIRGKIPEACTMGAFGELLHKRFKLDAEPLPKPGTPELAALYLFPGKTAADALSYSQHSALLSDVFETCDVVLEKLTHAMRVFGAQMLVEMGVDLQAVQRAGGWLQDSLGTAYIVCALCPQALLALALWKADDQDLQVFADPRFFIAVPTELLHHAMPALKPFEEAIEALKAEATTKEQKLAAAAAERLDLVMRIALVVRIQDAIATAEQYPQNRFNADMQQHPLFQRYVTEFKAVLALGGFDCAKPKSIRQPLRDMQEQLNRMSQGGISIMQWQQGGAGGSSRPEPAVEQQFGEPQTAGATGQQQQQAGTGQQQQRQQHQQQGQQAGTGQQQQQQQEQQWQQAGTGQQQQRQQQQQGQQAGFGQQQQQGQQAGFGQQQQQGQQAGLEQQQQQQGQQAGFGQQQQAGTGQQQQQQQQQAGIGQWQQEQPQGPQRDQQHAGVSGAQQQQYGSAPTSYHSSQAAGSTAASRSFLSPGGHTCAEEQLLGGYTPQGHIRRYWQPDQAEPFAAFGPQQPQQPTYQHQQPPMYQQQPTYQQQTAYQQQPSYHQQQQPAYQQPQTYDQQQQLNTVHLLRENQLLRNLLAQQGREAAAPPPVAFSDADLGGRRLGSDPIAELIQPTISNNPHLSATVGSRVQGGLSSSNMAQASIWAQFITDTVHQAIASSSIGHGTQPPPAAGVGSTGASCSANAAAGGGGGGKAPQSGRSGGNPGAGAPTVRPLPKLSDWLSFTSMVEWYVQTQDVPGTIQGKEDMYTRAELFHAEQPWCKEFKQRASEYDAIYFRLVDRAHELGKERRRVVTVLEAAADMEQSRKIRNGRSSTGISIYKFMKECEKYRKQQVEERRAKAAEERAAAAAAAEQEQENLED